MSAIKPDQRATSEIEALGVHTNFDVEVHTAVFHGTTAPATYDYAGKTYRYLRSDFNDRGDTVTALLYVRDDGTQPKFVRLLTPNGIVIQSRVPAGTVAA